MAAADPVSLGKRYQLQLTQTIGTLKEKAAVLKQTADTTIAEVKAQQEQLQPQLNAMAESYKSSVQDVESPVPANAAPFLLKSYLWAGVGLFAFSVARVVSGMFLYGVMGMILDTWVAMALTYGVFPAYVFITLRKVQMAEVEREQLVLFGAVVEGALVGALFSDSYLTIMGPPIFFLPLVMGLLAHYLGNNPQVAGNRRAFLGALVGGAMISHVAFGFVFNFNFTYIVSTLILGAAAAVDLQLKLASLQRGDSSPQLEQWKTVVMMTIAGAVTHYWASAGKQRAAQIKQEAAPKAK